MPERETNQLPPDAELREVVRVLDLALTRHRSRLREAKDAAGSEPMLSALRHMVGLMDLEAQRLRAMLPHDGPAPAHPGSR